MSGIIWLAGYPKSGNTWFRIFLANLLSESGTPADINSLETANFTSRHSFDRAVGWETSDLTSVEGERLRLDVQDVMATEAKCGFFKVHEAFTDPICNRPLFSLRATRAALYFIRNPLDVAVSWSQHLGKSLDDTIALMNQATTTLASCTKSLNRTLPQPVGDWSGHVRSWVDAPELRILVMRYEDMHKNTQEVFTSACRFVGLPDEPMRVTRALEYSRFEAMQEQERNQGFREALPGGGAFFRQGRTGGWRDVLSPAQVSFIVRRHGEVMRRFGYLEPDGSLPI
jgi:aryl sulfotransferase